MQLYDIVFVSADNISTLVFLVFFTLFYLSLFPITHQCLLFVSARYCQLEERRQTYIQCKLLEVAVYMFLLYMGIEALLRKVSIRLSAALCYDVL